MNHQTTKAHFAVKCKSMNDKYAPTLVAFVESYDAAIKLANHKNHGEQALFYPTIHTA